MSDIVERLRNCFEYHETALIGTVNEAADEIERLRQQVNELHLAWHKENDDVCRLEVELAALKQSQGEPVAIIQRNAAGQIHMTDMADNSFDISKHVGVKFYISAPTIPEGWQLVPEPENKHD